jgi:hypothetical protein
MSVIPMCKMCGEYEIATFQVHNDFCSDLCADKVYDAVGDGWGDDDCEAMMAQYDDDPSMYSGTYSED